MGGRRRAKDRAEALERGVRVGDPGVVDSPHGASSANGLIASRAIDNRIGAFVVLEALRTLSTGSGRRREVAAVATTQEEIGYHGGGAAHLARSRSTRQVAIVVDVTFATDAPGDREEAGGRAQAGRRARCSRAARPSTRWCSSGWRRRPEREGIPYTIQASPRYTSTDADAIYLQRAGVATAVVSVPNRYMHSPNEVVALDDVDATVRLLAAFCRGLREGDDFIPT